LILAYLQLDFSSCKNAVMLGERQYIWLVKITVFNINIF